MTPEATYNNSLTVADLTREEALDPKVYNILDYTKPHDECKGIQLHLGNMAGGFPFSIPGIGDFRSVEHLYMLGRWSNGSPRHLEIQKDILPVTSGWAVKRFKKPKYYKEMRTDFDSFKVQWMLWCIWQKTLNNKDFQDHVLSLPDDAIIVENVKNDRVYAAYPNAEGVFIGNNAVPKILTIIRRCLKEGTEPDIDYNLLNQSNIYLLGQKIHFSPSLNKLAA